MEIEKQYEWSRRGKKYKAKYLKALGVLYGKEAKEVRSDQHSNGRSGTNEISGLADKTGD